MKFKIHRGTAEIGGSCVEIWAGNTRLVVDFGMPLVNPERNRFDSRKINDLSAEELIGQGILPDIEGLYDESGDSALLFSHAHLDHFGLLKYVNVNCPVYMGQATRKLIELTNIFTNQEWEIPDTRSFKSGTAFIHGDFEITPYLMDHSAFDAYAFLIKAGGKSLFYSGDFRIHGRKAGAFEWFSSNVESNVDCVLLEGTTIGRSEKRPSSESELEGDFAGAFKAGKGISMVYCSGQNIDRLVSIYRACRKSGKILAIDFYIANVLKELSEFAKIPHPSEDFPGIRVFFPYRLSGMITGQGREKLLFQFRQFKISRDEIDEDPGRVVMLVRPGTRGFLEKLGNLEGGTFIYSMWTGYRREKTTRDFVDYLLSRGMAEKEIHTSGHADLDALRRMVEVLNPGRIVPIHTFAADEYQDVFQSRKVLRLQDRETVKI
jgi:ribonuclease J